MKKRSSALAGVWALLLLTGGLLLYGCTSRQSIPNSAEQKPVGGVGYLSAKEMEKAGKNSFGVPTTSFMFYAAGWKPDEGSLAGFNRSQWEQLTGPNGSRFRPANMPDWDLSNGDPLSIQHDCCQVERLFVVPWGSEPEALGTEDRDQGFLFPSIGYNRTGGVSVWNRTRKEALVFDPQGRLTKIVENYDSFPGDDWNIHQDDPNEGMIPGGFGSLETDLCMNQGWVLPKRHEYIALCDDRLVLTDLNSKKVFCRIYLPPLADAAVIKKGSFGPGIFGAVLYPEGFLLYPRLTEAGLEMFRYSRRDS